MTRKRKIVEATLRNPRSVRFADACRVAEWLGFLETGGRGSRTVFARPGEPRQLNFQTRGGSIPEYQARQLAEMINKYGGDL